VAIASGGTSDPEVLLRAADAAMYAAKRSGARTGIAPLA
jgi:hypothetical protein